mmetsp:Transcript_10227/g.30771  ORF Transcript_10227/g.30771 Transcript_10227/m.30771 type:complete len:273 (-) Transcript_10227:13-831(-)
MARPASSLGASSGSGGGGLWKSFDTRSSPALVTAASFNLRDFSLTRSKIPDPNKPDGIKRIASFDKIDLIGGNGRWRQQRAKEDFERRRIEEEEMLRQERLRQAEKERRRAIRVEMRRRAKEEEERKRHEEEERQLQERRERERQRQEHQERERQRRLEEEAERQRRMPKTCLTCNGSGTCQACAGKGFLFATFLVSTVNTDSLQEYGRAMQGCQGCGGCKQGIRGPMVKGAGKCAECCGYGKIWPDLDVASPKSAMSPKARQSTQAWSTIP